MILTAFIAILLIYLFGVKLLLLQSKGYCAADLGFIFLSLSILYTITPAAVYLLMDISAVPGWPWAELTKLQLNEISIFNHLWRHIFFIVIFLSSYVISRGRVNIYIFAQKIHVNNYMIHWSLVLFLFVIYAVALIISNSIIGPLDVYVDKYLYMDALDQKSKITLSIANRIASGIKYILILCVAVMATKKWLKISGLLFLVTIEIIQSSGARIEVFFISVGAGVAYVLFINKIILRSVYILSAVGVVIFMFVEIFRYYDFDFSQTLNHINEYGINPMGELGAVFFTGIHLYSIAELGQLPSLDWRVFFYDIISIFMLNSSTEFSPQYWYWNEFYPEYLVPPQTNGPIADSALWGMGLFDLGVRAMIIGLIFGYISKKMYKYPSSFMVAVIYLFFCSTCVMTLKYGVLWQLNPLIKTFIPVLFLFLICKAFVNRWRNEKNNIGF